MLSPQYVHTWANGIAQATLVVIEWQISSIIVEIEFFFYKINHQTFCNFNENFPSKTYALVILEIKFFNKNKLSYILQF